MLHYTVIIERGRESGYVAFCPALRGCVAQGQTRAETLSHLRLAMKDYIECLIEDSLPVPTELGKKFVDVAISV